MIWILSQPNNNYNPNIKTTKTVVGLRKSKRWEPHPHPNKTTKTVVGLRKSNRWKPPNHQTTKGTQNYKIEQKCSKTQKTKKNSQLGPQKVKNDPKIKSKSKGKIEETIENKSQRYE